jgi:acyl carrier protein
MINAPSPLLEQVKNVFAQEWKIAPAAIPDDAALNRFERWDSLGHITIMLALQSQFSLALTAETVQALTSLPRIVEHLAARSIAAAA